jgi:hypothetical protein
MKDRRCQYCRQVFQPTPYHPQQQVCGDPACQSQRHRDYPHVLRHSCALTVLQATKDLRKVSLWLGHAHTQATEMYTRVDLSVKLEALELVVPPKLRSGRFKATDKLIASLKTTTLMQSKIPQSDSLAGPVGANSA